jgi:hypothetical protein
VARMAEKRHRTQAGLVRGNLEERDEVMERESYNGF